MRQAIEGSSATFVGTVSAVENYRRWATVDVVEVWTGEVNNRVTVKGGPKDPAGGDHVVTTVDRSYRVGKTYLFVPYEGNGTVFRDNICSSTTPFGPEIERFRPVSATVSPLPEPTPDEVATQDDDRIGAVVPLGLGIAAAGLVGMAVWLMRRRNG